MYRLVLCVVCCLSVYANNTTLMVLINHMLVTSLKITMRDMYFNKTNHNDTEFKYLHGDKMDVLCVVSRVPCHVELTYDAEGYPLLDNGLDRERFYHRAVGLRMELLKEHNDMNLTCKCIMPGIAIVTLNVKFILLKTQDTFILPKINGYLLRPSNNNLWIGHKRLYVLVHYYEKDLQINCEGTDDNVINVYMYYGKIIPNKTRRDQLVMKVDDSTGICECVAYNKINGTAIQTLRFYFKQVPFWANDILPSLTLNLSDSNILLKSYRWGGDELIYYGYDDGDTLTLQCSTNRDNFNYLLNFTHTAHNGTTLVKTNSTKIIKHIKLSAADDGRELEYSLMDVEAKSVLKTIRVVLKIQQDIKDTTLLIKYRESGTSSDANGIIVIIGIVGAATIAIAVACVIRFVRKKNAASRTNASHLLTEINEDTSTPRVENQPDACSSLEYAYAYVGNDRAVIGVPQCPPACRGELPRVPDEDSSPVYDYAYGMCKAYVMSQDPSKCRGVAPATQHARNSEGSDYTDHYTEIDEYFIIKQMDRLKRKKEKGN